MAYSTALEEEEEAGWQCCMPPRGRFWVLTHAQGAAERVRNRDNPPPQPRPERHRSGPVHSPRVGLHKVCAAAARRQVQCHARARDKLAILVSYSLGRRSPNGRGLAPIGTLQHQICLVCPFLSRKAIFFCILGPVGTLYLWLRHSGLLLRSWSLLMP